MVNADGIDFRLLKPLRLDVAMFVALPALWGASVSAATDLKLLSALADVTYMLSQVTLDILEYTFLFFEHGKTEER